MKKILLSKSKYINGLQCPKYLWTLFNDPAQIPEFDNETQHIFDQGQRVGELAKILYPDGIDLGSDTFRDNLNKTQDYLKMRNPIFEAGILTGNLYCRIDMLVPVGTEEWDIVEVKSTTSVKDVHIKDVSFQRFCCQMAEIKIRNCFVAYINNQYVKDGEINPHRFFNIEDITENVEIASEGICDVIEYLFEVISAGDCPDIDIGKHCASPYPCPLEEKCWGFLPEASIFDLRGDKRGQFALYEKGILSIVDIPEHIELSAQQQIQRQCAINNEPHINRDEIRLFLERLIYPLYYLDFETINPAVPIFDGIRPYQRIPFQFSLHIMTESGFEPVHYSFLAEGKEDPRTILLQDLKRLLGTEGSIIAYNSGFEEGVLKALAEAFPEYAEWVDGIISRIVDLLHPFSSFHYYHPTQKGSASLKKVLPAVIGQSYEEMNIGAGTDASIAFERVTYGEASEEERCKVREDLEKYCRLDTEGMIWIVERLRELSG